jgi:uncharacterized protein
MISKDILISMSGPARTFLTAEWRHLVMLNYSVRPELLAPFVPSGTELDYWNRETFISLVGFRFLKTRVLRFVFPFHCNFTEVNLRFYVRRSTAAGIRRGVVFIREIVPRRAIALVARASYGERYVALPMSHRIRSDAGVLAVEYGWKLQGRWNRMKATTQCDPFTPADGSLEQFITEHYWGYARTRSNRCIEYQVSHEPWRVWRTREASFTGCMEELYGKELTGILQGPPAPAFIAEGSSVSVHRGARLPLTADPTDSANVLMAP